MPLPDRILMSTTISLPGRFLDTLRGGFYR